ncbi:secreted RxLR effector protein 161-like [Solanum lycopersicum]|uniref:secreted RxLR effector protein 161-like n=1 Tax=Solanum lycopersicum TaxID=4081 RepID=UPI003749B08C
MDEAHPLSTPMVVCSLDVNKYPFRPQEKDEKIFDSEVPYLSASGALMYLANTIRLDIAFAVNLLASPNLVGYADVGYLSDSHKARSQTGYVFICGGTAISWRSTKKSIEATSSNHAEIIVIHEASRECVWLRSMIHLIREKCGLKCDKIRSSDNVADLFTKSLPTATFKKMVYKLGMRRFKSLD